MGFKIEKAKCVEDGEYNAVLSDIQPSKGAYGPCLKIFFNIEGGNFDGNEVSMIRPAKLVPGNKLDKTLQSLGIDTSTVEDDLDVDVLKGKNVIVTVEQKTSEKGKVFANVIDVREVKKQKTTTPAVRAPVAAQRPPVATTQPLDDVPF